jgi:hypothetical protein
VEEIFKNLIKKHEFKNLNQKKKAKKEQVKTNA